MRLKPSGRETRLTTATEVARLAAGSKLVNRKGQIEIGVSVVLSEWAEGEREEED